MALARILAYDDANLDEALQVYNILLNQNPNDPLIRLEMADLLIRKGDSKAALSLAESVRELPLNDPETLVALADLEASFGHAARCRDLYLEALGISDRPEKIRLKLADRMNMWGDFYEAETIYREHLKTHPENRTAALQLAAVLRSSERYGESEGIYRLLLAQSPDSRELLMGLARVKRMEKKHAEAEKWINRWLGLHPDDSEGLLFKGDTLFFQKRYKEALNVYSKLSKMKCCSVKGLLGMGKVYLEQGKPDLASACFAKAQKTEPRDTASRFYAAGVETATSNNFVKALLQNENLSPAVLEKWARLYSEHGFNEIAVKCYRASIERDPDYFPSQIGLAEILAVDHQYDSAKNHFQTLAEAYPHNRKILTGWARVQGWGRHYDKSIALYDKIHGISPSDPVPQMEKARTAAWAKKMALASKTYSELLTPPVDKTLADAVIPVADASGNPRLKDAARRLGHSADSGSIFRGFGAFTENFEEIKPTLSAKYSRQIDVLLIRLYPSFAVQKSAFLEREGKCLTWNRRPTRAMKAYEELLAFTPGNEEAVFDYAQLECAMGLCDREEKTYRRLLDMDKRHSLAGKAMARLKIRQNPSLKLGQTYWSERGRNDLTEIDRYRTDMEMDMPVDCRFHVKLTGHHWIEHPSYTHASYGANGFTLGADGVLNPYIKGEAGWTKKMYQDSEFQNTDTGYVHIRLNLMDYAVVGLGVDRTDELYNYFGIKQGIQANSWWISMNSHITRRLEVVGRAAYMHYNDDNDGQNYLLGAGYAFTDHPRIFKMALTGEYRDTQHPDVYHYEDGRLIDITHPYWTPQDYYAGGITLEWYHDLASLFFCGSQWHFYDLVLTLGMDTEHNPSMEFEGGWHYQFLNHWTFNLKGLIHRSKLWDAEGIWADIRYQF